MKSLRPYQNEFIDAIVKKLDSGITRQIGVLPTGGGKTFTAVTLAKKLDETRGFKRILWCTHTDELLEQSGTAFLQEYFPSINVQTMLGMYGGLSGYLRQIKSMGMFANEFSEVAGKIGIVKAEDFDINADIVMASFQTLWRRLDKIPPDTFDMMIIDECHLAAAKTVVKSINHFKPKLLLGLTATPHRADGASLAEIFDEITYQYSLFDAIQDGWLCELDALQIQTKLSLDDVKTVGGEFNQKDLKETVDTPIRNELLLTKYKQYADGEQSIIFCVDVEHAKNVYRVFKDAGESAEILVGDEDITRDRRSVINRYKAGEFKHLINVMIATAGFDHPGIGCVILGCPTKSYTKFFQQIGRGTRCLPGVIDKWTTPDERKAAIKASKKKKCIVLDIVDTSTKHKLINTWTLEKAIPIEQRTFLTEERRAKLIDARETREKAKIAAQTRKDTRVNLFELPTVKISDSLKMKEPATDKQLDFLKRLGYNVEDNTYTKEDATKMISAHPASEKQIQMLRWKGYNVSNGVTIGEAAAAFKEIEIREAKTAENAKLAKIDSPIKGLD